MIGRTIKKKEKVRFHFKTLGKLEYNNGDVYEGDWKDDNMNGQGVFTDDKTGRYEGGFKNGMKDGKGNLYLELRCCYISKQESI